MIELNLMDVEIENRFLALPQSVRDAMIKKI
jgi:hypothetical protein